jgi:hypothetical protein
MLRIQQGIEQGGQTITSVGDNICHGIGQNRECGSKERIVSDSVPLFALALRALVLCVFVDRLVGCITRLEEWVKISGIKSLST